MPAPAHGRTISLCRIKFHETLGEYRLAPRLAAILGMRQ
jgi:hypothetical protein